MFAEPQRTSPGGQKRFREKTPTELTVINDTSLAVDIHLLGSQDSRLVFAPSPQRKESHVLLRLLVSDLNPEPGFL